MFFANTDYGFMWGSANITRLTSSEREGWVVLAIDTKKERMEIQVMKGGKIKILEKVKWNTEKEVS